MSGYSHQKIFTRLNFYNPPYSSALREAVRFAALRFSIVTPLYCFRRKEVFRQRTFYLTELFRQATFYLAELYRQIAFPIRKSYYMD